MKSQMQIHYEGKVFRGKSTDEVSFMEMKNGIFSNIDETNKLEMELEDGSFIVMGEAALSRSVFVFKEVKEEVNL